MFAKFRRHITYANVCSSLALFVALGGTSYAAFKLPQNSVGARELRSGSVASSELRDGSIGARDLSAGARIARRFSWSGGRSRACGGTRPARSNRSSRPDRRNWAEGRRRLDWTGW